MPAYRGPLCEHVRHAHPPQRMVLVMETPLSKAVLDAAKCRVDRTNSWKHLAMWLEKLGYGCNEAERAAKTVWYSE